MAKYTDEQLTKAWFKIIAKAWADPGYKKRLLSAPKEAFRQEGIILNDSKILKISKPRFWEGVKNPDLRPRKIH